ncbi:MAG: tryptophan--tRNA ligase [Candidatus Sericytochromatia bacterium]
MQERLFSGIRPTGSLHIGNYLGAVKNWVDLQEKYDSFLCVVDLHAITTPFEPKELPSKIKDMFIEVLACGVDPNKATLFVQSHIKEHAELAWILGSVTNFNWLSGMIQFKEKSDQHPEHVTAALFNYPTLQAADVALYKAKKVPIGEDQLQHIEFARDVIRKFNYSYKDVLIEPKELITESKRIMGLDANAKMGKSLNNYIAVTSSSEDIFQKLRPAVTDPARIRKTDAGTPEKCNIYTSYHKYFSDEETLKEVQEGCTKATIGCIDCKKMLHKNMDKHLTPIREKYHEIKDNDKYIQEVIDFGKEKAQKVANETIKEVKEAIGLT